MEYKDYYKILGVDRNATQQEIKQAFLHLARKYHPDVNKSPGAESKFKEINEAHEVLSDPEKRKKYDMLGAQWQQYQQSGGRQGGFDWSQWASGTPGGVHVEYGDVGDLFGGGGFSDFFQQIFGGMGGVGGVSAGPTGFRRGRQVPRRGQDVEQPVEITLEEAYHGTTRRLRRADGSTVEVHIPAGVKAGSKVRVRGEGGRSGRGGPAGDLYLKVRVRPHSMFTRQGKDLHIKVPVDLYTAVLGGEIKVPTMEKPVLLTIPPETDNGKVFRLRGKGMPQLHHPEKKGDLLATIEVRLPHGLTPKERELFQQLRSMRRRPA